MSSNRVRTILRMFYWALRREVGDRVCDTCNGQGERDEMLCPDCGGRRRRPANAGLLRMLGTEAELERQKVRLSVREFARKLGLRPATLSAVECGCWWQFQPWGPRVLPKECVDASRPPNPNA